MWGEFTIPRPVARLSSRLSKRPVGPSPGFDGSGTSVAAGIYDRNGSLNRGVYTSRQRSSSSSGRGNTVAAGRSGVSRPAIAGKRIGLGEPTAVGFCRQGEETDMLYLYVTHLLHRRRCKRGVITLA